MLIYALILVGGIFFTTFDFQTVLNWMINFGIDWQRTLLVVALHIPAMIVFALPAGTLMGTILVLYFMRRDGSLLALRLAGVGYARIFLPFLLVGIMATVVSYSINEFISPVALATARRLIFMAAVNTKMPLLNKDVWQTQALSLIHI